MHLPLTHLSSWGGHPPGAVTTSSGATVVVGGLAVVVLVLVVLVTLSLSRWWAKAEPGIALAVRAAGVVAVAKLNLTDVRFALWEYLNLFSESLVIMISLLSRKFTKKYN